MIKHLNNKYENIFNFEKVTEKEIIYFCRDALNHESSNKDSFLKVFYEKEILELIKLKEWDWFKEDIDKNNILTYPIYNNAFEIVKYLIENKKYNLKKYDTRISNALQASIILTGQKMQEYITSQDIHNDYVNDMIFKAYEMTSFVKSPYVQVYFEQAERLMMLNIDFKKLLDNFLKINQFEKINNAFFNFLEKHPSHLEDKKIHISSALDLIEQNEKQPDLNIKYITLKKWLQYHDLNHKLITKEILRIKKFKI
jgi:hypothetical protein